MYECSADGVRHLRAPAKNLGPPRGQITVSERQDSGRIRRHGQDDSRHLVSRRRDSRRPPAPGLQADTRPSQESQHLGQGDPAPVDQGGGRPLPRAEEAAERQARPRREPAELVQGGRRRRGPLGRGGGRGERRDRGRGLMNMSVFFPPPCGAPPLWATDVRAHAARDPRRTCALELRRAEAPQTCRIKFRPERGSARGCADSHRGARAVLLFSRSPAPSGADTAAKPSQGGRESSLHCGRSAVSTV